MRCPLRDRMSVGFMESCWRVDSNKAKFSDHETWSDHSFLIWRSRANQGWLEFKSPKEVSCLDFARLHHSQISPTQVAHRSTLSLDDPCMSRTSRIPHSLDRCAFFTRSRCAFLHVACFPRFPHLPHFPHFPQFLVRSSISP